MAAKGTTHIGYRNKNNQTVIRKTSMQGTDFGQTVYVLRCGDCGAQCGLNGSDNWQRLCPYCQGGKGEDLLA